MSTCSPGLEMVQHSAYGILSPSKAWQHIWSEAADTFALHVVTDPNKCPLLASYWDGFEMNPSLMLRIPRCFKLLESQQAVVQVPPLARLAHFLGTDSVCYFSEMKLLSTPALGPQDQH